MIFKQMPTRTPKPGEIYIHFKNPDKKYRVIGIAKHTETEEDMVVYQPLYENPWAPLVVRPLKMFIEEVDRDGYKGPRFRLARAETNPEN
jgi:hypothetical protein